MEKVHVFVGPELFGKEHDRKWAIIVHTMRVREMPIFRYVL